MANSSSNLDLLSSSQASKEISVNALIDAASPATTYGRRASTTAGLTFGFYGGNVTKADGTLVQVANGTVALTASQTNYVVAEKATGTVSVSTATTNWNDTDNYWRLYSIVAGASTVTSYTDSRQLALFTGSPSFGAMVYQGSWDASANTPTLASGTGTKGYYYVVSVSGTTTIDGVSLWTAGDIIVFNGTIWEKIDASLSAQELGNLIGSADEKTTPVDADMVGLMDSAAGNILKKLSWANIKTTLASTFAALAGSSSQDFAADNLTANDVRVGDMGAEGGGINIGGVTYDSTCKVSDINGANYAQTILHRHSTTLEPLIVGARSNDDTSSHTAVTNGQGLFSNYAAGSAGNNYKLFGAWQFAADDTGTISETSAPGKWTLSLTPNGSVTPAVVMTARNDKSVAFAGAISSTGNASLGDSEIFDAHVLKGKSTVNDARFAAVSASLPALSYVDTVFHLAKDDTDKGAWRKKKGQSWRSEARSAGKYLGSYATLAAAEAAGGVTGDYFYKVDSTAFHEITGVGTSAVTYRGGREDYSTNPFVTIEAARPIAWDADGAQPSMWGVCQSSLGTLSSVAAMNNNIVIGTNGGMFVYDFAASAWVKYSTSGKTYYSKSSFTVLGTALWTDATKAIVNSTVNDVAITVLPDAPIDEYGMPVPTISVGTAGGWSQISHDGSIWDFVFSTFSNVVKIEFLPSSRGVRWTGASNTFSANRSYFEHPLLTADLTGQTTAAMSGRVIYSLTIPSIPITQAYTALASIGDMSAIGYPSGLNLVRMSPSSAISTTQNDCPIAYITSTYNTGYMVGDIRRCFLSNSKTADRSIKAATLTEVGTVTETTYSGGRSVYSGFSASNYLQEASHADWNALGTGNFSIIMSGVKWGTAATLKTLLSIGNGASEGSLSVEHLAANTLRLYIWSVTPTKTTICTTTATFTDTAEHTLEIKRSGTTCSIVVDGIVVASGTSAITISNATGYLRIGEGQDASQPLAGGQVSCVRISATAPTSEQSKFIAATENALNGGNACLLSNSNSVSALSYDKDTDSLLVGNGTNVDTFQGLKRIASQAHGVTTLTRLASINGRKLIAGTGATYTAPERNISAELLEGQQAKPRTQNYSFTSSGTTKALPQGWKAQGVQFNLTDGTMASASQTFDGFIWTLGSLTNAKAYQIQLVEA